MWRNVVSTDYPLGEWEWDDGARFRSDACQAYCDRQEDRRERARAAGFSSVYAYNDEMRRIADEKYERSSEGRAAKAERAAYIAEQDARYAKQAELARIKREAAAKQQAEEHEKEVAQAHITIAELNTRRIAETAKVAAERQAAYAAYTGGEYRLRDAQQRAAKEMHVDSFSSQAVHAAYLYAVLDNDWQTAIHTALHTDDNFWWDPVPMTDEEKAARRLLGQPIFERWRR